MVHREAEVPVLRRLVVHHHDGITCSCSGCNWIGRWFGRRSGIGLIITISISLNVRLPAGDVGTAGIEYPVPHESVIPARVHVGNHKVTETRGRIRVVAEFGAVLKSAAISAWGAAIVPILYQFVSLFLHRRRAIRQIRRGVHLGIPIQLHRRIRYEVEAVVVRVILCRPHHTH